MDVEDTLAPGASDWVADALVEAELDTVVVVDAEAPAGTDWVGVADVLAE